jgi:ribosomal protein S18 acetylase RimI-like enzyme
MPDLRPASSLPLDELAALFNAGYEGYVIPFRLDADALRSMMAVFDIDRDLSRVAFDEGEPVGFANLALRGDQAWVGGVGVVAKARRRGIGRALMDALHAEATARGMTDVWLEVIEQNDAAFRLYDKLGYEVVREVEVWSLPAAPADGSVQEVDAQRAHTRVRELRRTREPWQRADATLAHYDNLRGLETDRGAAVFRVAGNVQVQQIAGEDSEELLRALRGLGDVTVLNLPTDDPAAAVLHALGATIRVRQHEMVLKIHPRG